MTNTADIAQVLEDAADLLLIHGVRRDGNSGYLDWIGGQKSPLCAFGGMCVATDALVRSNPDPWASCDLSTVALDAFEAYLFGDYDAAGHRTFQWNDTSLDDFTVIDALRRCAKDLRNASDA